MQSVTFRLTVDEEERGASMERKSIIRIWRRSAEFECPKCQSRMFVPIAKYKEPRNACMNCQHPWLGEIGGPNYTLVHELLQNAKLLARLPETGVKLRFLLHPPPKTS